MANLNSSSDELDMLKKMFNKLDTDKNGTLTIDEIKKGMDEIDKLGISSSGTYFCLCLTTERRASLSIET